MTEMIQSVVVIGAGNLATQLVQAMHEKEIGVDQVFSKTIESARTLAEKVNCTYTCALDEIRKDADLYIIAIHDYAIQEVLMDLRLPEDRLIVHTAGSVSIDILKGYTNHYGVFYPLQTFSKSRKIDFTKIPVCIEANHPANLVRLQQLGQKLSENIHQINSEERKVLHMAAVFACNFVNHMYALSEQLLKDKKLCFDILHPLIQETADKVQHMKPIDAQTGPAVRYDKKVIQKHMEGLSDKPDFQKLYSIITDHIFQLHQKH